MRDRPEGVRDAEVAAALADGWGIEVASAEYRPVGAGSYHWGVVDAGGQCWFVTVDDLGVATAGRRHAVHRLRRALDTALALRYDAGLGFVVAPVPARPGGTLRRLGARYALSVFPVVDGVPGEFGRHRPEDRDEMVRLLAELHRATPVVEGRAGRTDLRLPGRDRLQDALDSRDREWTGGPFAEPARRLLTARAGHVERRLDEFDRLVGEVRAADLPWVVTHGEPHPGNVIRTPAGLCLVDWDTVLIAPAERDLWLLADGAEDRLADYTRHTGRPVCPAGLALFRLWWALADIAIYLDALRRPHRHTADITAGWHELNGYLRR